jgi:Ca2+-binding EF-hand superfamily protein
MDTNGDGVIREDEIPEERRGMFRMMTSRLSLDPAQGISIDKLRETLGSRGGPPGAVPTPGLPSPNAAQDKAKQEPPLVPGFGIDHQPVAVAGFGTRIQPVTRVVLAAEANVDPQIRALFGRFDRNGNGLLDRDEWTGLPDYVGQLDTNQDGRITLAEVGSRMAERQRQRQQMPSFGSGSFGGGGFGGGGFGGGGFGGGGSDENEEDESAKTDKRPASYRFRSARERLPEGLPGWFVERDADSDGQVAMAEFARQWDRDTIREYFNYDGNRDGLITPEECLHQGSAAGKEVNTGEVKTPSQPSGGAKSKAWWQ